MASDDSKPTPPLPQSLGDHVVPEERARLIREHMAMLGRTALAVSDQLPFQADTSDFLRVLESDAEEA